jgi:large subunit ribosomal protein L1
VKKVLAESKERKFVESIDVAIGLKDINLKDPTKRFRSEIVLPHTPKKVVNIAVVGDDATLDNARNAGIPFTLTETDVNNLVKDPKEARKFVNKVDYVLAVPQLMAVVGKNLGRFLGPVGKTPSVIPPNSDIKSLADRYTRTCKLRLRQNPVVHARVATRNMSEEEIVENVTTVIRDLENKLEQGQRNINAVHIKTTMGPAIKVGEN